MKQDLKLVANVTIEHQVRGSPHLRKPDSRTSNIKYLYTSELDLCITDERVNNLDYYFFNSINHRLKSS